MTDPVSTLDFWEACYQAGKTGWDRGETHPALLAWQANGQIEPCRIVVPGCGNGYEVISLIESGFDVTAIDFAQAPLEALKPKLAKKNLKCELLHADVFSYHPSVKFEAVYEQTCLCAIDPTKRETYEKQIFSWLNPGGKLFALFMQAPEIETGPPFTCSIDEMKTLFPAERWQWPTDAANKYDHPNAAIFELSHMLTRR